MPSVPPTYQPVIRNRLRFWTLASLLLVLYVVTSDPPPPRPVARFVDRIEEATRLLRPGEEAIVPLPKLASNEHLVIMQAPYQWTPRYLLSEKAADAVRDLADFTMQTSTYFVLVRGDGIVGYRRVSVCDIDSPTIGAVVLEPRHRSAVMRCVPSDHGCMGWPFGCVARPVAFE